MLITWSDSDKWLPQQTWVRSSQARIDERIQALYAFVDFGQIAAHIRCGSL